MIELINPYVVKIIMAVERPDSIRGISKRCNLSYGWAYYWSGKLLEKGILIRKGIKIFADQKNSIYQAFVTMIKTCSGQFTPSNIYEVPSIVGLDHAFCEIDAVFIWTKGGYNISRDKDHYPIFIQIKEEEKQNWMDFFEKFKINYSEKIVPKKGVSIVLYPVKHIDAENIEGNFVISLKDTVEYCKKNIYNFQPALEMLNEAYGLGLEVKYAH